MNCPDCDAPLAGDDEARAFLSDEARAALCWRFMGLCHREPVDWRARALSLARHIDEANANAPRALTDALASLTERAGEVEEARREIARLTRANAALIEDAGWVETLAEDMEQRLRARIAAKEAEIGVLVEQWHRAAVSLDNYDANHGERCAAEQERYATIAESACRMLDRVRDSLHCTMAVNGSEARRIEAVSSEIGTFLSAPGHEVPGLRAELRTVRRHLATSEQFLETFRGLTEVHLAAMGRAATDRDHWRRTAEAQTDLCAAVLEDVAAEREGRRRALAMVSKAMSYIAILTGGQGMSESSTTEGA